jgi:hypothetical protein
VLRMLARVAAAVAVALACGQAIAQTAASCAPVAGARAFSDAELLRRFPDQPTYNRFRYAALEPGRKAMRVSQERLDLLRKERRELDATNPSPDGSPLPLKLRQALDVSSASIAAQEALMAEQQCNLERQTEIYDRAASRLGALWPRAQG